MQTDAVIVGSGPNGLVAANLLADQGWTVQVVEAAAEPGGAVRSGELIEPGFTNDLFSAFYPLAAASSVLSHLDLESFGLRWCHAPLVVAHPTADGTCPVLSRDLDVTAESLDEYHPGDGDAWRRIMARWHEVSGPLLDAFMSPFPPVRAGARLVRSLPPQEWARFVRFLLLPVRRMGEEEFGSPQARRLLAGLALHTDMGPETGLSGMFGWLMGCLGQTVGFPVPEGGSGALSRALVRRLEANGGSVRCSTPVDQIVVKGGRAVAVRTEDGQELVARRAVLADISAPMLYGRLIAPEHLPARLLEDLERFQWDNATVKVDWTLDAPIPWTAPGARKAGTVHIAEGVDALTVFASELARSLVPARPFLLVGQQSMTDQTRQPAGRETAWAYTHVPREVRGDNGREISGRWDEADVDAIVRRIENEMELLAPGFSSLIRGRHVFTPPTLEAANANLNGGALNGGTTQLHQQLIFRPVPGAGRAGTPIDGLFLASSSAHPGGGVHGAAGSNAARAAIAAAQRGRASNAFTRTVQRLGASSSGDAAATADSSDRSRTGVFK